MQKLPSFFILFFPFRSLVAQKNFEGKVVYKFVESGSKKNATMTAFFGDQKIKAVLNESDSSGNGKDDLLIDFKNGIVHHINSKRQTYHTDSLSRPAEKMPELKLAKENNKIILGHQATAYTGLDTSKSDFMGSMKFTVWYADSVYFPFDKIYAGADMVPMLGNGSNISLGMNMNMGTADFKTGFQITPVSIEPQQLTDSLFAIPAGYTQEDSGFPIMDSVKQEIDSILMTEIADSIHKALVNAAPVIRPAKKTVRKKSSNKPAQKLSQKNNAVKPEE